MISMHDVEADEVGELERPHRVVEADPRAGIDVLGRADPLLERPHRLGEERHQDPVDDEPRPVGRDDDLLAELAGRAPRTASTVSSDVAWPRISSTSGMTGTGLKKCIPRNRSRARRTDRLGQAVDRDRARVRGEDRVRAARAGRAPATGLLDVEVLEDGLDDEVRVARRAEVVGRVDPRQRRVARPRVEPALGDGPVEVAGDPVAAGLGPREVGLVQRRRACRSRRGPGRCRGP